LHEPTSNNPNRQAFNDSWDWSATLRNLESCKGMDRPAPAAVEPFDDLPDPTPLAKPQEAVSVAVGAFVQFRHDPDMQTAHVLVRYGFEGDPRGRLTGYRGRNDQMKRERDERRAVPELAKEYGLKARSSVYRATAESRRRAAAVLKAIRAKMEREPLVEFSLLRPVLRTDLDLERRTPKPSMMRAGAAWYKRGNTWINGMYRVKSAGNINGNDYGNAEAVRPSSSTITVVYPV